MLDARLSRRFFTRSLLRGASAVTLGTLVVIATSGATQNAQANGDTRSLTLYHTHRGDSTTVTFKRNGRYDGDGLRQLSYFLRDWRNDKQTRMEPRLFDIVWEVHRQVGRGGMINIVSSYRSPETNAFLRARSSGVAKFSQHMLGRAMDFYITGVPVSAVREAGVRLQRGGVGFYPTSGRPFVHLDAGNIRAWPRMSRTQLAKLFPGGKTVHQPAEGGQMPGYQVALAELKSRGEVSLDSAYAGSGGGSRGKGLFAMLFGGGEGDEEAANAPAPAMVASAGRRATTSSAGDEEGGAVVPATRVATVRIPVPSARPADMGRAPAAAPQAEVMMAAANVPMPPVAPERPAVAPAANDVVATASIPLPPVAPAVVAAKPIPLPPSAPADAIQVASAERDAGQSWRTGASQPGQPRTVNAAAPALALASAVPTPKPRPTPDSAVAVLAALPTPAPSDDAPRQIDPQAASAAQAEASSFPRLPDGFLGKRSAPAGSPAITLAYAPQAAELPVGSPAVTRAAVAPKTRVTAAAPVDPNVRVLSPYSTPAAVYAAAIAPQRKRATLAAPEALVTARMDDAALRAAITPSPARNQGEMIAPDLAKSHSLLISPTAALMGGFGSDPTHGARSDRFSGSSVMLLRTQSFLPGNAFASGGRTHG